MPIYDYKCRECGDVFEKLVFAGDDAVCASCGSDKVERMLSAPGHVGISATGGNLQCGKDTTCCGAAEPCGKPSCHRH